MSSVIPIPKDARKGIRRVESLWFHTLDGTQAHVGPKVKVDTRR
jgi:hypothetical protein